MKIVSNNLIHLLVRQRQFAVYLFSRKSNYEL